MTGAVRIATGKDRSFIIHKLARLFPGGLSREIEGIIRTVRMGAGGISEIRLRTDGVCSIVMDGENLPLISGIDREQMANLVQTLCRQALYAYRDTIMCGYITAMDGVRVGIVGDAKYENGQLVGISDVGSLVFRIPTGECEFASSVYDMWKEKGRQNMLICSPPGAGKTTLLRALASLMGTGRDALRVVVVDERREFIKEDYLEATVDLIRGYSRSRGIELAVRTMSPEVILVDEVGTTADAEALLGAIGIGVPVIATAHGDNPSKLRYREGLGRLIDFGMFPLFVRIKREGNKFEYTFSEGEE